MMTRRQKQGGICFFSFAFLFVCAAWRAGAQDVLTLEGARTLGGVGRKETLRVAGLFADGASGDIEKILTLRKGARLEIDGTNGVTMVNCHAHHRDSGVRLEGGTIAALERCVWDVRTDTAIEGAVRLDCRKPFAFKTPLAGGGTLIKTGPAPLVIAAPCHSATGTLMIAEGEVRFKGAGMWGGKIVKTKNAKDAKIVGGKDATAAFNGFPKPATAYSLKRMRREKLGRGVYAFRSKEDEVVVSWRYLSSDPTNVAFNVFRDGVKVNDKPLDGATFFIDKFDWQNKQVKYRVECCQCENVANTNSQSPMMSKKLKLDTGTGNTSTLATFTIPANAPIGYLDIELEPPQDFVRPDGMSVAYHPMDCSVGDVDGDGEFELFLEWYPDNAANNLSKDYIGPVYCDCYKVQTGKRLWRISLGTNIRACVHYTQFIVYDLDGDGTAELLVKTAPGTVDAKGRTLGEDGRFHKESIAVPDYREANSRLVLTGKEFLTVFNGATGEAMDAVAYDPPRGNSQDWGDNYGNRSERYLATLGWFDGVHPSAVFCKGYYTRTVAVAWDWDGRKLSERWRFDTNDDGLGGYACQGFHNIRSGDVDFDGKDEVVFGSMVIDHDGKGLHTTGMGHGDAQHLVQATPDIPGLQLWTCHENKKDGVVLRDAWTGRIWFQAPSGRDVPRCLAADLDPASPGMEFCGASMLGVFDFAGNKTSQPKSVASYNAIQNYAVWWSGDMRRQAYNGNALWNYSVSGNCADFVRGFEGTGTNNASKQAPCIAADIFGDWREEMVLRREDNRAIRIYMTDIPTPYRFHTFLEDPVYRSSVATLNVDYNQPTHTGFYFGPDLLGRGIWFRGALLP